MKKTILMFSLLSLPLGAAAQVEDAAASQTTEAAADAGVRFEKMTLEEALVAAGAQGKMVFVDVSMTGCVPCKFMEKNIFPLAEVGTLYNDKFISLHVNATASAAGRAVADKYGVRAFPTFLFLTAPGGELVHTSMGGKGAPEVLQMAQIALTPEQGSVYMNTQWVSGNRDFDFLVDYYLMNVYESEGARANAVIDELVAQYGADFKEEKMCDFFFSYVNRKNNPLGRYFLENTPEMIKRFGKEKVFNKIGKLR